MSFMAENSKVKVHLLYEEPIFMETVTEVYCGKVRFYDCGVLFTWDKDLVTCGDCNSRKPNAIKMAAKNRQKLKTTV